MTDRKAARPAQESQPLPVDALVVWTGNARRHHRTKDVKELAADIKKRGVIQPVIVRTVEGGGYEVIAGGRRLTAARTLKLETIPAIVRDDLDDLQASELSLVENTQRQDLNLIEMAETVADLAEVYSAQGVPKTTAVQRAGEVVGVGRSTAYKLLSMGRGLCEDVRKLYHAGKLDGFPEQAWMYVSVLEDPAKQLEIATDAAKNHYQVWAVQRAVEDEMMTIDQANFDVKDAKLKPKAGACAQCSKNSANAEALFEGMFDDAKARCRDRTCWDDKLKRHVDLWLERGAFPMEERYRPPKGYDIVYNGKVGPKTKPVGIVTGKWGRGSLVKLKAVSDKPKSTASANQTGRRKRKPAEREETDRLLKQTGDLLALEMRDQIAQPLLAQVSRALMSRAAGDHWNNFERRGVELPVSTKDGWRRVPKPGQENAAKIAAHMTVALTCEPGGDQSDSLYHLRRLTGELKPLNDGFEAIREIVSPWLVGNSSKIKESYAEQKAAERRAARAKARKAAKEAEREQQGAQRQKSARKKASRRPK